MFRRSPTVPIIDPDIGELTRTRGWWRGEVRLDGDRVVPLAIPGPRRGPDPDALDLARSVAAQFDACRAQISAALDEHRIPYADADVDADDPPVADAIATPTSASVTRLDGTLVIEIAYRVSWDDDHTLGARLRDGRLVELNGSIVEA